MKTITTLLFSALLVLGVGMMYVPEKTEAQTYTTITASQLAALSNSGYSCVQTTTICSNASNCWRRYTCTRNTVVTVYDATQEDYRTLTGFSNTTGSISTAYRQVYYRPVSSDDEPNGGRGDGGDADSPFIYFYNMPEGEVSVSVDSHLDTYYPKPAFNQENGWVLNGEDGMNFKEDDSLFYELEVNSVTLNRNGTNFTSKEDLTTYLNESELFTTLGFSDTEKENALGYLLPKIEEVESTNYYYLTVLSDEAVSDISQLSVTPAPDHILRQYVAVYPTPVPVKTNGDFLIPQNNTDYGDAYVLKETGEFLISNDMFVSFE
jgi:hypothetical protein